MNGHKFLDLLEADFKAQMASARAQASRNENEYDEAHNWLQQFAVGNGLDVATGNFPTRLADDSGFVTAVDSAVVLGTLNKGFNFDATNLVGIDSDSLDFVISNYLDGIAETIHALNEWHRVLKSNGTVAVQVPNADHPAYNRPRGPLTNPRKLAVFTAVVLERYLERAGFTEIQIICHEETLRACAKKP